MLGTLFGSFLRKRQRNIFFLNLWNEIKTNLERYHVIDQRQFITMDFKMTAWENSRHLSGVRLPAEVVDYAFALEDFNRAFADCQAFEHEYASSLDNKTLENAQILHAKKEALDDKFRSIRPKILAAEQAIRAMMGKGF
jgi:hypothetical protein